MSSKTTSFPLLFLRIALSVTMLSAVADRFGLWGDHSAWGNWENFEKYTAQLTFFLPAVLSKGAAYLATFLEIVLSLMLLLGFKLKLSAITTGILLLMFALSMSVSLGVKAPLDYSVWVGSAAAFVLATQKENSRQQEGIASRITKASIEKSGNIIMEAEHPPEN